MKKTCIYCVAYCIYCTALHCTPSLLGIWENDDRFIEYTGHSISDGGGKGLVRMVLKPYYRFVYEKKGTYPLTFTGVDDSFYNITIRYPDVPTETAVPLWINGQDLFVSFYRQEPYEADQTVSGISRSIGNDLGAANGFLTSSAEQQMQLHGFWIEYGNRTGIKIYPEGPPESFDAFFFSGSAYIRFRYWKENLAYQSVFTQCSMPDGTRMKLPKYISRNGVVYTCITGNGRILRNFEQGSYAISGEEGSLTFSASMPAGSAKAGPGTYAAAGIYPHSLYPQLKNVPFQYSPKAGCFAFGQPFLTRSAISNLDNEIEVHNGLKRSPSEPVLQADELDFQWDRIQRIRGKK